MALQKHLLNDPDTLVVDSLTGLCAVNNQLSFDPPNKVVFKSKLDRSKVALICGGGSGHEPSHAGFVGEGMLSAAVCGNVFASPNSSQVHRGIDLVENDAGTLILVKNYTGDILNFGLAAEQYAAEHAEKSNKVKFLVVGDDVAVGKTQGGIVGRRGLAGVVLVYKIAGALAAQGGSLDEVYSVAEWAAGRIGTIGVGLEHCHVPGTAPPSSHLSPTEIEIGLGIHNEAGNKRLSPVPLLTELIPLLVDYIASTTDTERGFLPFKNDGSDEVVLLVNNLGGMSELEIGGVVRAAREELHKRQIGVRRVLAGTFMTSLSMPGFSLSLLLLPRADDSSANADKLLSLLDAPAQTPGWKWNSAAPPVTPTPLAPAATASTTSRSSATRIAAPQPAEFLAAVQRACAAIAAAEPEITRMDTIAGDGDCGLTLKAGAQGVEKAIKAGGITGTDLAADVVAIAKVAENEMGGTSGALYSIFFSALAQGIQSSAGGATTATPELWGSALSAALTKLYTYTRARPPSRTLVDPLAAFVDAFGNGSADFAGAVKAAAAAAEHTKDVDAKAGRSAYVDTAVLRGEKVPDPGAWGVKTILEAL
ncbi:dihydroxyacetone kinase [Mycena sanguinolenta]|nr:dihydroxyacetone kinase [Mycena sanguinolenta]